MAKSLSTPRADGRLCKTIVDPRILRDRRREVFNERKIK